MLILLQNSFIEYLTTTMIKSLLLIKRSIGWLGVSVLLFACSIASANPTAVDDIAVRTGVYNSDPILIDVLANDVDDIGDGLTITSARLSLEGGPAIGVVDNMVEFDMYALTFDPNSDLMNKCGDVYLYYIIENALWQEDEGSVILNIACGVTVGDDEFYVDVDTVLNFAIYEHLLPNDFLAASGSYGATWYNAFSPEGDIDTEHGYADAWEWDYYYTPDEWFCGQDSFEYTRSIFANGTDELLYEDTWVVSIQVWDCYPIENQWSTSSITGGPSVGDNDDEEEEDEPGEEIGDTEETEESDDSVVEGAAAGDGSSGNGGNSSSTSSLGGRSIASIIQQRNEILNAESNTGLPTLLPRTGADVEENNINVRVMMFILFAWLIQLVAVRYQKL